MFAADCDCADEVPPVEDAVPALPEADNHGGEVSEVERARQREIAAYLSAASFPPDLPSGTSHEPFLNPDPTLNALVQLGALRLDCDRSFLSLIDRQYQWVAAEITRSHSIREMRWDGDDRMFLGVAKLDACWGVCPTTMKAFMDENGEWIKTGPNVIANRTRYIIHDFKALDDYKNRPYVAGYPYFYSYCEVPLISPLGYLLGSYCVVDNKPHFFDDDETVGILNDIADAIMAHLENVRIKQSRNRSEQLIRGLGDFIASEPATPSPAGSSSAGASAIVTPAPIAEIPESSRPAPPQTLTSSPTIESSVSTPSLEPGSGSVETPPTSMEDGSNDDGANPARTPSPQDSASSEVHGSGFISSANIKSAFFRAASTIRQAMDLHGLLFLDAVPGAYTGQEPSSTDSELPSGDDDVAGPFCAAIVQSSACQGAEFAPSTRLPEAVLQRFIHRFPRGHVFSADEFGPIDESYSVGKPYPGIRSADRDNKRIRNDVSTLFRVLPEAKYIVFLPLWHFQRECWYAATLGWVTDATHALDSTDISLVTAFGNSIMAEVSRLEALAASRAKSSFVSSISHELRTPLHGIMASSELLREAVSDPWLLSTLDMLDSCGKSLLDTFNNLLDHAISIKDGRGSGTPVSKAETADLASVVEDVVEAVHFSHISEKAFQSSLGQTGVPTYNAANTPGDEQASTQPLVLLSIANSAWRLPIDVGAWKRIIMNIFGNALKYTKTGRIEVGLSIAPRSDREGNYRDHICFRVEDTGRGMSSDYLKYNLFTPFSQEDTYSPGIGLGLSIVQQLTISMGGAIDVKSSVGVGTVVEVWFPLEGGLGGSPGHDSPPTAPLSVLRGYDGCLVGRTLCLISAEAYASSSTASYFQAGRPTARQIRKLSTFERAFRLTAGDVLGMKVVVASSKDDNLPPADIYLLDGDTIRDPLGAIASLPPVSPLVLLCSRAGSLSPCPGQQAGSGVVHLHHPIGPKKLVAVLSGALTRPKESPEDISSRLSALNIKAPPAPPPNADDSPGPGGLVREEKPKPPIPSTPHPPDSSTPAPRVLHLLLVDDNPINVKLLAATARKLKHTFETACHGLEAVEAYKKALEKKQPFDTVFMDISMPVMDGFEAIREIRQLENEMKASPCRIAALTGLSSELSRKEALSSGSDLFLTKPVKMDTVKKLLDEQLEKV